MVWLRSQPAETAASPQSPRALELSSSTPEPSPAVPCVSVAAPASTCDLDSPCDDARAAVWEELEALPVPPPLSSSSCSAPSSPVVSASSSRSPSAAPISRRSPSSSPVPRVAPALSLGELILDILEGTSDVESDSDSESGSVAVVASTEVHIGLTDDSDDEDVPDRPQRSRLRRGDETSHWHLPLPKPPACHPSYNRVNHYDPSAPWDYTAQADISRLLDVSGDPPHRCFLVQWKGSPLQLSWVWEEHLDNASTRPMMDDVLRWKASGTLEAMTTWHKERDVASAAGTCFMDAFRSALYYLGQPNLVTMEMWDAFEDTRPPEIQNGVTRDDVTEFFKVLQRQSVPLNYDRLMVNLHSSSSSTIDTLHDFCMTLDAGAYIVSAGEDGLGHCFVVISHGPGKRLISLDDYDTKNDPPMVVMPLRYQEWVKNVKWICRVELQPGYQCRHGKRKSKTQRKREKRLREQQQQ